MKNWSIVGLCIWVAAAIVGSIGAIVVADPPANQPQSAPTMLFGLIRSVPVNKFNSGMLSAAGRFAQACASRDICGIGAEPGRA